MNLFYLLIAVASIKNRNYHTMYFSYYHYWKHCYRIPHLVVHATQYCGQYFLLNSPVDFHGSDHDLLGVTCSDRIDTIACRSLRSFEVVFIVLIVL